MEREPKKLKEKHGGIIEEVSKAGINGIWLSQLARKLKIPKPTLWYWLKNRRDYFQNIDILDGEYKPMLDDLNNKHIFHSQGTKVVITILRMKKYGREKHQEKLL